VPSPSAPVADGARLAREMTRRLVVLLWVTGVAGSAVVFTAVGFLIPVFLDAGDVARLALLNLPLLAVYLLAGGALMTVLVRRRADRALRWLGEGRAPDADEHAQTLDLPRRVVLLAAASWLLGGTVFSLLNLVLESPGFAAVVAATIWLGGEMMCALLYLAAERALRPATAGALAARPTASPVAPGVVVRLTMAWALGTGVPLVGVVVVAAVGLTKDGLDTPYVAGAALFLGAVAAVTGPLATHYAARAIADPITAVGRGLARVSEGELDVHVPVDDGSEVGLLQAGFNRMADGLRERERLRDLFGRQVGEDVARAALREGVRLGGEERHVGALFVDVIGSTALALAVPPTEVVRVLNRFFRVVVEVVEVHGALVNKFEGDAALCVFGAPVGRADPAGDALRAARALAGRLARELPEVDFGVGVSAGTAVAGNVGAERRFEYTVIGDPVNEAARLCDLAKQRPDRVLASDAALAAAGGDEPAAWTVTDSAVLRGRGAPTRIARPRTEPAQVA
jgi:adenylate cyclase